MESREKFCLTPVAGAIATALAPAGQAVAQDGSGEGVLEEITVTATKRSLSVQDIPAAIQAITAEALAEMGAKGMEDYSRFVPSVNVVTYGAGSNTVVFRGAITSSGYIAQSTSSVYLDEISITTTGSQPSIRMVDIERVEALSGPQGTLYGSDAQAGTMRIITNKPIMNETGVILDGEVRGGSDSDMSYRGSITVNVPLIEDKLAARLVGFSDHDGGFIDNVFGHTPDSSAIGGSVPAGFGTLDNADSVEERWNDADVYGGRLILQWDINDKWSTTLTALTQETNAGADNDFDPFVGDLKTIRFHKEYRDDEYQMYSLVVNGDLGFGELVGSVNYYDRDIKALFDITAYAHYWAALYCYDSAYTSAYLPYYWVNPDTGYAVFYPVYCAGPTVSSDFYSSYYSPAQQDKLTAEIRLSGQNETADWIVGLYVEDSNDSWQAPFATPTAGGDGSVNLYQNSVSLQYWEWYFSNYYGTPVTYPEATSHWYSQSSTDWEQTAIFGEYTWHATDNLDLTIGGRWYERTNNNKYIVDHPGDIGLNGEPDVGDPFSRAFRLANNGAPEDHEATERDFIPKVTLSYTLDDDRMMYGLYTRGARPGGVNRSRGQPFFPLGYQSDLMDNYEAGYRSNFGNGKGRFNATAYYMKWLDYQLELVDPSSEPCATPGESQAGVCGQPWQQIVTNAGEAHIQGINLELDYAFNDEFTFGANAEFLEAETDTTADLNGNGENDLVEGLRLPLTPEFKGSAWLDYTTESQIFGSRETFARAQISYTGSSLNKLEPDDPASSPNPQFKTPSYTIADLRAGIRGEDWELSVFLNNVTDERAVYTIGTGLFEWGMASAAEGRAHVQRVYTNRPRELGIRFTKSWGL